MNQTAAAVGNPSSSWLPSAVSTLTGIHLALIALLAILVIIGIIYGARLKRRREDAEAKVEADAEEAGIIPARVPAPPPTAPSPPPLSDAETIASAAAPLANEPIAAAAIPLEASPQVVAASAPGAAAAPSPENGPVTQLKGLGPKVAARLADLGVTTVGQIAALDAIAAARLDAQLGPFKGRMERDRWIEQARFLAAGDKAGFEAVFGKL